eukprot:3413845-Rhodomonas_salina.1
MTFRWAAGALQVQSASERRREGGREGEREGGRGTRKGEGGRREEQCVTSMRAASHPLSLFLSSPSPLPLLSLSVPPAPSPPLPLFSR